MRIACSMLKGYKLTLRICILLITGTLHEEYTFLIISRWILHRMRNVSNKNCRGNQNTHFLFRKWCRLWVNVEKYCTAGQATDDHIIPRMRIACSIINGYKRTLRIRILLITGTLHEEYTFLIISRWILHRMRNVSNKNCRENQNTHFLFRKWCRFELMWRNIVQRRRLQMAI